MRTKVTVFIFLFLTNSLVFADTIILKNGQIIEGKILEKNSEYIKIDFQGVGLTYFKDQIKQVIEENNQSFQPVDRKNDIDEVGLIDRVLQLSGAKKQLEEIPDYFDAQSVQYQTKMKPEVYTKVRQIMEDAFRSETLYQAVVNYFKDNFDRQKLITVLDWLEFPLTKKMSQLEVESSSVEAIQEMKKFAAGLQNNPPTQERLALVQELDKVVGASDTAVGAMLAMYQTLIKTMNPFFPPEEQLKEGQLEEQLNKAKMQLQSVSKDNTLISFLYTYRSVSDDELRRYIDFYKTDTGSWFTKMANEALIKAVEKCSEDMGNKMARMISQPSPKELETVSQKDSY